VHKQIGIGVVGAGTWGGHHADVFSSLPATKLVAICDAQSDRAEALAAKFAAGATYTDFRAMLDNPEIDAVSVATPDFAHTQIVLDALAAGKHVLCEKPLAMTKEEGEKIKAAAEAANVCVMVDFHNRASPVFAAARDDVAAGKIGRPIHGAARLSNSMSVPLGMLSWANRSSALWFLGSHAVDVLRFVLGDEVRRVFSMSRSGVLKSLGVDTADVHVSMLEFSSGTIVSLENSWVLSDGNPQIFDFNVGLVGDKGQLQLNPSHNGAYSYVGADGMAFRDMFGVIPAGGDRVGGFVLESIARFVDAVVSGATVLAGVDDGIAATRVLLAIEESVRTGQSVDIVG
jgi:predicted dehydrogenase